MRQFLTDIATRFPDALVRQKPGKFAADYVEHSTITERLLLACAKAGYDAPSFGVDQFIYGDDGTTIEGCIASMTINGVTVTEVGDCEQPSNWKTNGQRGKDAISDAYKRCAMRFGVGLHLWSQDLYFLDRKLAELEAVPA